MPELTEDWPLLRTALGARGVEAEAVPWRDTSVDWSSFDLVLANGVWDYLHRPDELLGWIAHVADELGVPVVNSPDLLRWNMDKHYLRDLEAAGVPVVPTTWIEPGDAEPQEFPEGEFVVKPAISCGGFSTARYGASSHAAARAHVEALHDAGRTVLVQPYQGSVDTQGETALVFLGGVFSHAVCKGPMLRRHAGPRASLVGHEVVTASTPSADQIALGTRAVAAAARTAPPAYARVDTVRDPWGRPCILELELLEPALFLATAPGATDRFADVLTERLAART
ncbi:MAG TPA: hypothetical protein VMU09_04695 [Acidimicrobiales bacterium]|nr:hypothetical protein [Acidimicrobiales bacterium]